MNRKSSCGYTTHFFALLCKTRFFVEKYKSTKVQKYKNTKIQKYKNTKIQKYKNTKIHKNLKYLDTKIELNQKR
jgi:hypothetical protein